MNLLEQMADNTNDQAAAIANSDQSLLASLLEGRQILMDQIDVIDNVMTEYQSGIRHDTEEYMEICGIKERIQSKLKEIYVIDQENIDKLKKQKREAEQSIHQMNIGKKALTEGYFKSGIQAYGYFFDKKIGK
ncbi:MAG: hypothetical protein PWP27_646 [Clostridiales bacterium]|jgi:acetyl-CoA carboxylase alpha subunit|nr:hypothetical protein [Petroclostridium sp.]MDK2932836.1 hypothetical protein [Clostridiales bacterium]